MQGDRWIMHVIPSFWVLRHLKRRVVCFSICSKLEPFLYWWYHKLRAQTNLVPVCEISSTYLIKYNYLIETKSDASCNVPEIKETEDGGYYNTVQINTDIRIEDLQDVILRKSVGENNTFLHEYKVLSISLSYRKKVGITTILALVNSSM